MTELEWIILDEVYLMNDYDSIRVAVGATDDVLNAALVRLLEKSWLRQLTYSDAHRDYIDVDPFNAEGFRASHFVITRQGLLQHTGTA